MFGRKRDEEDFEYIGNVFDKDEYGKLIDEEDVPYENISDEYVESLFTPYLFEGEEILCVINGGSKEFVSPGDKLMVKSFFKSFGIVSTVISALFVVGVLLGVWGGSSTIVKSLLMLLPFMLIDILLPVAIITAIVTVIRWNLSTKPKGLHFAVTNRRIIGYGYKFMKSFSLGDIREIKAKVKKEKNNTGRITVYSVIYDEVKTYWTFVIPRVKDPLRVKYILDQAIEKYKANQYQG